MSGSMKILEEISQGFKRLVARYTMACPHCLSDLTGEEIPVDKRQHFGGATHGSRRIGVIVNDRVAYYECPDCNGTWPRIDARS